MGRHPRRLTRARRAQIGFATAVTVLALGVYLVFGVGWACIVAGTIAGAWFAVAYDVDEPEVPVFESRSRPRPVQDWSEEP